MADVNKWLGVARLTRDAEMKYLGSGTAVLKFSVAVNSRKKQGDEWVDEVTFLDCVMYGKGAEAIYSYMVKGKQVAVEGRLHQARWESDGQARSKIEIVVENVQLLGGGDAKAAPAQSEPRKAPHAPAMAGDVPPDFPDDIPF